MSDRFLAFAGHDYYPGGGANDLVGEASTFAAAETLVLRYMAGGCEWGHVLSPDGEITDVVKHKR